jgi:hypothetical protein
MAKKCWGCGRWADESRLTEIAEDVLLCPVCEEEFERGMAEEEARFEEGCRQALTITEENSY